MAFGKKILPIELGISIQRVNIIKKRYIFPNSSFPNNREVLHLSICEYTKKKIPERKRDETKAQYITQMTYVYFKFSKFKGFIY